MAFLDASGDSVVTRFAGSVRAPVGTEAECICPDPIPPLVDVPTISSTSDAGRFGVDVNAILDVPLIWDLTSGTRNLGNALARRFGTPRGSMPDDPDYGFDVRDFLGGGFTAAQIGQIRAGVVAECLKDERVQSVDAVDFTWIASTSSLRIVLVIDTSDGAFRFVLEASAVTVALLEGKAVQ